MARWMMLLIAVAGAKSTAGPGGLPGHEDGSGEPAVPDRPGQLPL